MMLSSRTIIHTQAQSITYLFLTASTGAAALLASKADWRFDDEPSPLKTVLTRESTFPNPFFSFPSLGTEDPAGAEELMIACGTSDGRVRVGRRYR